MGVLRKSILRVDYMIFYSHRITTNNAAELYVVRQGLQLAWKLGFKFLNLDVDSKLVLYWLPSFDVMASNLLILICDCEILLN